MVFNDALPLFDKSVFVRDAIILARLHRVGELTVV